MRSEIESVVSGFGLLVLGWGASTPLSPPEVLICITGGSMGLQKCVSGSLKFKVSGSKRGGEI